MNGITKKLIKEAQYGNNEALDKILKEVSKYSYYRLHRELGINEDSKECVQNIINNVFMNLHKYDFTEKYFMNWLNTIIGNEISNKKRTNNRFEAVVSFNDEYTNGYPDYKTSTPERNLILEDIRRHIGDEYYIILYYRLGFELSFEDMAVILNMSVSTVKRKFSIGYKETMKFLGEKDEQKTIKRTNKK